MARTKITSGFIAANSIGTTEIASGTGITDGSASITFGTAVRSSANINNCVKVSVPNATSANGSFVEFTGDIIPSANNSFDQGNAEYKWNDIYYNTSSDRRLKENIEPYSGGLNFIDSLNPVTFTWNNLSDKEGNIETGFIAQEVKESLDNSNYESYRLWDGSGEYEGIDTRHLIPALVSAIKELKQEIEELKQNG